MPGARSEIEKRRLENGSTAESVAGFDTDWRGDGCVFPGMAGKINGATEIPSTSYLGPLISTCIYLPGYALKKTHASMRSAAGYRPQILPIGQAMRPDSPADFAIRRSDVRTRPPRPALVTGHRQIARADTRNCETPRAKWNKSRPGRRSRRRKADRSRLLRANSTAPAFPKIPR